MVTSAINNYKIKFLHSLKGQIFILFLALSLIPLAVAGGIVFFQSQRIIREDTQKEFTTMGDLQAKEITNWILERKKDTLTLSGIARIQTMQAETACPAVDQYFKQWAIYQDIFVLRLDGSRLCDALGKSAAVAQMPYFQNALRGNFSISDTLIDEATGTPVIVTAAPLLKNDETIGVIALSISTDYLSGLLKTYQTGQTREAYLVGNDGFFITESRFTDRLIQDGRLRKQAVLELKIDTLGWQRASKGESGLAEYTGYNGQTVLGAYRPIPMLGSGAALLLEQDLDEVRETSNQLRNSILLIALCSGVVVVGLAIAFGNMLTRPLILISGKLNALAVGNLGRESLQAESYGLSRRRDEYGLMTKALENVNGYLNFVSVIAGQIAHGDLTAMVIARSEEDEIGNSLHQMIQGLRELIGDIKTSAGQLQTASNSLDSMAGQTGRATSQISTTIQQVALGINQQAESVSRTAVSASQMDKVIHGVTQGAREQEKAVHSASQISNQITRSIQDVALHAQTSTQRTSQAGDAAHHGVQTVEETVKSMQSIKLKVGQSAEKVQEMGRRSDQIGAIVETIEDIASQTNMLALNAAIEAARAGEQGKGFAIVADEVRKLAERSASATREIGSLICGIQTAVADAITAMDAGAHEVESGVVCANQSGAALNNILSAVEIVSSQVKEIATTAQEISRASDGLVVSMNSVSTVVQENIKATEAMLSGSAVVAQAIEAFASVSEENSAAVEEVSASTVEMNSQVEAMSASATSLAQMSRSLQGTVARFKTG